MRLTGDGTQLMHDNGCPLGDVKDWTTSSELAQWRVKHNATVAPSHDTSKRIKDIIHEPS
jgi:hypothetical protein